MNEISRWDSLRLKMYGRSIVLAGEAIQRNLNKIADAKIKTMGIKQKYAVEPEMKCKHCKTVSYLEQVECIHNKRGFYFICNSCSKKTYFKPDDIIEK